MLAKMTTELLTIGGRSWSIRSVPHLETLLAEVETESDLDAFPYGLLLWPAAVALAECLVDHPQLVQGRRVLELGCGPGLPGLTAQWLSGSVTLTDYQEPPLVLARENAALNSVSGISVLRGDWRAFPDFELFDVVIGSDILYERTLHSALHFLLLRVLAPGGTLLLADPLRPQAAEFMDELEHAGWEVTLAAKTIAWREQQTEIALFTARRNKRLDSYHAAR